MFDTKQKTLFDTKSKKSDIKKSDSTKSIFVESALKNSSETLSANGALKYSTTGDALIDQFSKLGSYKEPRSFSKISNDCELVWAENKELSVLFSFYIRMITRKVQLSNGESTTTPQRGAELKHEGIFRMIWLHMKDEKIFWDNIGLFVSAGSWKDIFVMLRYDLEYNGWENKKLNWDKFGNLILSGLNNENVVNLVKKYLPQIKANSKCTTLESQANVLIGKWICSLLFGKKESSFNYKQYRLLKNSGTSHEWQQLISQKKHDLVDFSKIHGRALNLLVRGKYLDNQGLMAKYESWVTKVETEVKYTGFVHELFTDIPNRNCLDKGKYTTINKQFDTLVEKGKSDENINTNLIVVRDTSGSMGSVARGANMSCFDIGKALALYFSEFLTGKFSNAWVEFASDAEMRTWKGDNALDKWYNDKSSHYGGTEFQSVIHLFCQLKNQGVDESEFPSGILCISDSEFNPTTLGKTNVETAKDTLRKAGFSKEYVDNFVIVLWNLQSSYYGDKFETFGDVDNVFYFSGYSASTIAFLTSDIKNAKELFLEAMNQELLNMIKF
jgi:hypothetical protein